MAEAHTPRPVSGEMMTTKAATPRAEQPFDDVIDAEYVEVRVEPRVAPPSAVANAPQSGMSMLNKREANEAVGRARGGPVFWIAGVVLAGAAFWVSGGHAVVRDSVTASSAALEPQFRIVDVQSRAEQIEGSIALLVSGNVVNDGAAAGDVPALRIEVIATGGKVAVYRLGTSRRPLAPSAQYGFSSRLDMPKDGVKTVTVAFEQ